MSLLNTNVSNSISQAMFMNQKSKVSIQLSSQI